MKVYGPYFRKDGRQHVIISVDGKKKTVSYPRYLMQQVINRELTDLETVDHIDGDFTNNDLSNLQILTREANASKKYDDHPQLRSKYITYMCPVCNNTFQREERVVRRNQIKRGCEGPYCSKSCASKIHH
jgi:hypothetical protein